MKQVIITEALQPKLEAIEGVQVLSPSEYIHSKELSKSRRLRVLNLCNSYDYQSTGYYVSLLAQARGHRVIPEPFTLMDFKLPSMAREDAEDFDGLIQEVLRKSGHSQQLEFKIYFGRTEDAALSKIGRLLFSLFQMPVLKVVFHYREKWMLQSLKPAEYKDLSAEEVATAISFLGNFVTGKNQLGKGLERKKYDLAILTDPNEATPPSDEKALQRMVKAAEKIGFNTEFITRADFGRITQFDALFIRETTNVNHYTFRFARKAEYEGLAVMDDATSILKCTNKVYLHELMSANKVPVPKAAILQKKDALKVPKNLSFPMILKEPDGAFSKGVKKVSNEQEFKEQLKVFMQDSDLVIAQEFMPTEFDWRVGVLGSKALYVCKYYMARNHWQIADWSAKSKATSRFGRSETIAIADAPPALIELALKATKLIGDGLYGVDIKQVGERYYVIEVNDNPNIDSGIEDLVEKNKLYESIMGHFMKKVLA